MPVVQEFLKKLTANERMAVWGAAVVTIASIFGGGWLSLVGAIAVIVIYWLKYSPTSKVTWPAPIQLIVLAISGIIGLFALLGLVGALGLGGLGLGLGFGGMFIIYIIAAIAVAVGAGMMVLGTWREYQIMPKTTSATSTTPPAPSAAPMSTPPPAPSAAPMSTPPPPPPASPPPASTTPPDSTPPA